LGGEKDGSESTSIRAALNRFAVGDLDIYASGSWSKARADFDNDSDYDGRLNNTNDVSITEAGAAQLQGKFQLGDIDNTINLSYASTDIKSPYASFRNDTLGQRTKLDWMASKDVDGVHNITALGEIRRESFAQDGGIGAGQNQSESLDSGGIALDYKYQDTGAGSSDIVLQASIRQSFHDRFENALTWRVGGVFPLADYLPIGDHLLRASYGTGVKNPTMTEIFGFFPSGFIGNPNIKPERSEGFNVGYQYGCWTCDFVLSADYFRSNLKDEIATDFSVFPNTVRNLTTKSLREGVEIETQWHPMDTVTVHAAATHLTAKENGIAELRRPELTASASVSWQIDDVSIALSASHTGSQFDTDFSTYQRVELPAFTLVGLNITYALNDIITVSLRGDNLLDADYQEVVGYASQGRGVYGGLSARF
jgi:vitamin B12 transporter